jgi:hypothetical protein
MHYPYTPDMPAEAEAENTQVGPYESHGDQIWMVMCLVSSPGESEKVDCVEVLP